MNMVEWLNSEMSARLILTLGHSLWQGLLIAILATILNASFVRSRRRSSTHTYSIWLVALAALIACPFITFALTSAGKFVGERSVAVLPSQDRAFNVDPVSPPIENLALPPNGAPVAVSPLKDSPPNNPLVSREPQTTSEWATETWRNAVPYVAGSYACIVALLLVRLIIGLYAGRSLRSRATPLQSDTVIQVIDKAAKQLSMRTAPLVLACQRVVVPTVVGVLQPVILLPAALITTLPVDQMKSIIAHEMAHIKRWDHLVNVVQRTVEAILFFNPGMWWVSRQLRIVREHCCDDMVVDLGVCRTDYATMLLDVAEFSQTPELQAGVPLIGPRSSLGNRVRRLLGASNEDVRLSRSGIAVLVALLTAILLGVTSWPGDATAGNPIEEDTNKVSMHAGKAINQSAKTIHIQPRPKMRKLLPPVDSINKNDTKGWGEVANGLQARLTPVREFWQQWEQPRLLLEVRNLTEQDTTLRHLTLMLDPDRKFLKLHGLRQRRGNFEVLIDDVPHKLATQDRIANFRLSNSQKDLNAHVPIIPAGKLIRMPVILMGARNSNRDEPVIQAGRYPVTLKHMDVTGRDSFVATAAPLEILPHGISTPKEYTDKLVEYSIHGSKILAGFVPNQTTIVYGTVPRFSFVVRNPNDLSFGYSFGGDYRGTGRHDRFKIEIRTDSDQLLKDPKVGANGFAPNFGGLMGTNKIAPHGIQSRLINANDFRTIPGPGTYKVKCEFDLRNGNHDTREFEQIVQSEFTLTVLPPNQDNVSTALDKYFKSANSTSGAPLYELVNSICLLGKQQAVAGLIEMASNGDRAHRRAAIHGLGLVPVAQSRDALIKFCGDADLDIQVEAVRSLGSFKDDQATDAVVAAFDDGELAVQQAAAKALGAIGNDKAVLKLLDELQRNTGHLAIAVLEGIGNTESSELVEKIAGTLDVEDRDVRQAAVNALVSIGGPKAIDALSKHKLSPDMEFREYVVRHLVEKLRQPMEPEWLVPVLKSRKNTNSNGDAPRLMRIYCKDRAAPAILSAMDFDNPKVRSRYNRTLVWDQLSCVGALAIPWIGDLNRDGTPAEIAKNKETLRILKLWVARDAQKAIESPPGPWPPVGEKPVWGVEVDKLAIAIRANRTIWPEGLPQVIMIDGQKGSGSSASFQELPPVIEVEVDGEWYDYDRKVGLKVVGDWNAYKGRQFHDLQLDERWLRKSDNKPLVLKPGKHSVRTRLSTLPETERTGLATSPAIEIEVLKTSN